MSSKSLSAVGVLALGLLFTYLSCSGGDAPETAGGTSQPAATASTTEASNGGPTDSGMPGLILAKSIFNPDPSPSAMVLLRPTDAAGTTWERETIMVPEGMISVQLGDTASGEIVVRQLDSESKKPIGSTSTLGPTDGVWGLIPSDATDVTWRESEDGKPIAKTYEMAGGNVFHKCMWWEPKFGKPGILTISANMPYLLLWHREEGKWNPELLWTQHVGGKEQRYRDIEIGDVDGDGQDELVLVTHDLGAVYVLEQTEAGLASTEIHRFEERTFVHEVEIADIDGDGKLEFFTTPSEPNRLDGHEQAGWVDMYRYNAKSGKYDRTVVAELLDRHAKEIMLGDYDGDGISELYVALEAEGTDKVVGVRCYVWKDTAMVEEFTLDLKGKMCRFLNMGDTDGDGVKEIFASTRKAGIFKMWMQDGEWTSKKIIPFYVSSSFEHATVCFDWDGDGKDDLFVASDDQKVIYRFVYNTEKGKYDQQKIGKWSDESYFVWGVMPLPAGQ